MSCGRCSELDVVSEIRTPGDLGKAIRIVQANLRDGTLEELPRDPLSPEPFLTLKDDGPWNDIVSYRFRCTACGARFRLSAETYHGSGGEWTPERTEVRRT
jgi:hypothetical protein